MHTREIPKEKWQFFLDEFSRQHELWRVSLNVTDREAGAHAEIEEVPLFRISLSNNAISIALQTQNCEKTIQLIRAPIHLWLEETEEGAHKSLQIESSGGISTILSFRSAVLPESMDGILKDQART